ncbi:alpha/beta hydrolase-fold protein [Thalassotalea sp. 1_MG-2023]|uniref:alpha/beta hydrolase n=1 Tax=Thalassotalea sp. 1_MG-2023 TaxID=3062680 RepID=UPI0026E445F7|nr:alpha/beta hydrolase-fold protein [Thalassotalea sp. 1_MG-2023]MDO6425431.1 alpha/beta hydrolase-fold protein [Thalassotalea sp. 1_MG-2023]
MRRVNIKAVVILLSVILCVIGYVFTQQYNNQYTSDYLDQTLYSSVLDENRKIFIRLPRTFDKHKQYPLIIRSDGNFNLKRWDDSLHLLHKQQMTEEFILVSIPNLFWQDTRNRDLVPPYARKDVNIEARPTTENNPEIFGKADLFLAFIEKELIPHIEKQFKISSNRVLSGFSAGGSFVLYTIVTKPQLFTGYFAFSPAAWYDDSVVVKQFKNQLANTVGKPRFLYLSLGAKENDIITGSFEGLLEALKTKAPENLYWQSSYSADAGHADTPFISVPKALKAYHEFIEGL